MGGEGVTMRRLSSVFVASLLAVAATGGVAAQSPSPDPDPTVPSTPSGTADELRLAFPEVGFALTFPDHWTSRESDLPWGTLAEVASFADPEYCYVQASEVEREDVSAAGAAEALVARYEREGYAEVMPTPVLLPAGGGWRVDAEAGSGPLTVYLAQSDQLLVALHCTAVGSEAPDDAWLSIAETIEFLPAEE